MGHRPNNVKGSTLKFQFKGESEVSHDLDLTDSRLVKIVKKSHELPG
jgi:DNA topoisomerase IB